MLNLSIVPSGVRVLTATCVWLCLAGGDVLAQNGALKGKVTIAGQDTPVHNALIVLTQLKLMTQTDEQGRYEFKDVPNGTYSLVARLERLPDNVQRIEVNGETTVDF